MSEVGVAQLRQDLKQWVARAQAGDEVIITERGRPVARLTGVDVPTALAQLTAQGRVSQPTKPRTQARGAGRIQPHGPVSEYIVSERDSRRP